MPQKEETAKYFKENGLHFIETTADNISIELVNQKTLDTLNCTGINGTFYQINSNAIWGIAMQDNKELHQDSYVSNYKSYRRGTVWFDGEKMHIDNIYNAKTEIAGNIKWAISGISLYPFYDPAEEGFVGDYSDVLRNCNHTAIGFKGNKVYLIVTEKMFLVEFKNSILNSSIAFDGLINLDGGGSTQMNYEGKSIISSSRRMNHAILVR